MTRICPSCQHAGGHHPLEEHPGYRMYRCPSCKVEFADPMKTAPDDERIRFLYEGRTLRAGEYLGWYHQEFLAARVSPGGTLLDVGCGTGDFVAAAIGAGYRASGIDTDAKALEAGRRHHGEIPLTCIAGEAFLGAGEGSYDVITFFEVLEHLADPSRFLEEVRDRLVPGGAIALSVPNNDSPLAHLYRRLTRLIDAPPHHLTRWTKEALRTILGRAGFTPIKLVVLGPTLTDQVSDVCRVRLTAFHLERRLRIGSALTWCLRVLDIPIRRFVREGRGMFVLAKRL